MEYVFKMVKHTEEIQQGITAELFECVLSFFRDYELKIQSCKLKKTLMNDCLRVSKVS